MRMNHSHTPSPMSVVGHGDQVPSLLILLGSVAHDFDEVVAREQAGGFAVVETSLARKRTPACRPVRKPYGGRQPARPC